MTKDILFKAKTLDTNEWVEGYYVMRQDIPYIYTQEEVFRPVDIYTLGEWTGQSDKNCVKIFENDIIMNLGYRGVVVYGNTGFYSKRLDLDWWRDGDYVYDTIVGRFAEVIGNVGDECDA